MTQRYNCQEKLDASHSLGWKGWLTHSRDKAYCNLLMWDQWLTTRHFTGLSIHDLTPTKIPRQPCPAVNSYLSIFHFVPFSPFFPLHFISFFSPFVSLNPSLSYVLSFFHFLSPLFNLCYFHFFLYFYLIFSFYFSLFFSIFSFTFIFPSLFHFLFCFHFFLLFLFIFCFFVFCVSSSFLFCFTSYIYNNI